jgi:Protein of unknown function (DUF3575)
MQKNYQLRPLIACLFLISFSSFSQIDIDLKTNVFTLLKPNISVEVGAGKASIEMSARFYKYTTGTSGNYVTDIEGNLLSGSASVGKGNGMNFTIMPAYYLSPKYSLDGWKIAPYANYNLANETTTKTTRISAGGIIGYKGFFSERIGMEFGIGYGKAFVNKSLNKATNVTSDAKELEAIPLIGKLFKNLTNTDIPINLKIIYRFGEGFQK